MKLANDIRDMIHDTYFLKKTVLLAVPVAMQGLLNTVVNLVDNLMTEAWALRRLHGGACQ